jgi:Sortase domain
VSASASAAEPASWVATGRRLSRSPVRRATASLLILISIASCGGGDQARSDPSAPSVAAAAPTASSTTVAPVATRPATLDALAAEDSPEPVSVRLPAIGVDAEVRAVGVEADGEMEVPSASDVGWYRFGPSPGDDGSAVLAGHVDYNGQRGVFFELRNLSEGDQIEILLADGSLQAYEVVQVAQVPKGDLSASGVFDRGGPPRLALITCGGSFDTSVRSYRDNVVAYATPLGPVAS